MSAPTDPLRPIREHSGAPDWPDAIWVGEVNLAVHRGSEVALEDTDGYAAVRLLVRDGATVLGFVEYPRRATLNIEQIRTDLPKARASRESSPATQPLVSVVIPTRNRRDLLARTVDSIVQSDYPDIEIVVADNNPSDDATRDYVTNHPDQRVRYVLERTPGGSAARNSGVRHTTGDIIAFVDDDTIVDRRWLARIVAGFARAEDIGCVTGLVPSMEVESAAQAYFDQRVNWSKDIEPRTLRLSERREIGPLFPFQPGVLGTGANFAVRRDALAEAGGFDESLGPGTPACGGEDLDVFIRIVMAGWALQREPSAIVWHQHRRDIEVLDQQLFDYGVGLGAWITKVLTTRAMLALLLKILFANPLGTIVDGIRRLRGASTSNRDDAGAQVVSRHTASREYRGILTGPARYLRSRRIVKRRR